MYPKQGTLALASKFVCLCFPFGVQWNLRPRRRAGERPSVSHVHLPVQNEQNTATATHAPVASVPLGRSLSPCPKVVTVVVPVCVSLSVICSASSRVRLPLSLSFRFNYWIKVWQKSCRNTWRCRTSRSSRLRSSRHSRRRSLVVRWVRTFHMSPTGHNVMVLSS